MAQHGVRQPRFLKRRHGLSCVDHNPQFWHPTHPITAPTLSFAGCTCVQSSLGPSSEIICHYGDIWRFRGADPSGSSRTVSCQTFSCHRAATRSQQILLLLTQQVRLISAMAAERCVLNIGFPAPLSAAPGPPNSSEYSLFGALPPAPTFPPLRHLHRPHSIDSVAPREQIQLIIGLFFDFVYPLTPCVHKVCPSHDQVFNVF